MNIKCERNYILLLKDKGVGWPLVPKFELTVVLTANNQGKWDDFRILEVGTGVVLEEVFV